jgi:hypothetical membrane protein
MHEVDAARRRSLTSAPLIGFVQSPTRLIRIRLGAIALVVAGAFWILAEAITAAAWRTPVYSYAVDYISDLGVPGCGSFFEGREQCSPLAGLMNSAFVAQGTLLLAGVVLLGGLVAAGRRAVLLTLAGAHWCGLVLIAVFHGGAANEANGTLVFHGIGAFVAIAAGNALPIVVATARARALPRWFRWLSIVLPVVGEAGEIVLLAHLGGFPDGVYERSGVYSFVVWEVVAGVALLAAARLDIGDHFPRSPRSVASATRIRSTPER